MQKAPTAHEFTYDEIWRYERFITTVQQKAGISWIDAERAARATLERGRQRSGGKAQRMSLDEFVGRIAEREGVSHEHALDDAGAVFATLRDALPDKEFSDILHPAPARLLRGAAVAATPRRLPLNVDGP
ncbi:MAG: DUF2267 domain-containing protein [Solirubrobacteraceae bacterium]